MKILVGSLNPVKIEATRDAFSYYFDHIEITGVHVPSHVSDQPIDNETYLGAQNRVTELQKLNNTNNLNADYFVGIEGGICNRDEHWFAFGAMCIMDKTGRSGLGTTIHFELPPLIYKQILKGKELGAVIDSLTNEQNTKQKGGAIQLLTKSILDRKTIYVQGLIAALIPILNDFY